MGQESYTAEDWLFFWAPHFTDERLKTMALAAAEAEWGECACGDLYEQIVGLTAAHLLTLRNRAFRARNNPGGGTVQSMTTGGQSITWAIPGDPGSREAYYSQTEFGQQVLELFARIATTPIVAGSF